jgi:hypothetical protein
MWKTRNLASKGKVPLSGIQFQVRFLVRTLESTGDVLIAGLALKSYFKAGEIC